MDKAKRVLRDVSNLPEQSPPTYARKLAQNVKHSICEDVTASFADITLYTDAKNVIAGTTRAQALSKADKIVRQLEEDLATLKREGLQDYTQVLQHSAKELGKGKSGTVFGASLQGTTVAVKTMVLDGKEEQEIQFFVEEVKMGHIACSRGRAGKSTHICKTLGVVRNIDATNDCVNAGIIMEHVAGSDLVDYMAQGQFWVKADTVSPDGYYIRQEEDGALFWFVMSREEKLSIALQLCSALVETHSQGVLHCDIKPENTMVTHPTPEITNMNNTSSRNSNDNRQPRVTLIDFGLSVRVGCPDSISAGTPGYEAPEAEAFGEVSVKSDVYSLGRSLAELWTGSVIGTPDEEQSEAMSEAAGAGRGRAAKALELLHWEGEHTKDVEALLVTDPHVGHLIARCLAEQPEHRPAPRHVARRLRKLLRQERTKSCATCKVD